MIISAPRLFLGDVFAGPGSVQIEGGRIVEVFPGLAPAAVALEDGFLAPGLIDLHNNGAFGVDCATATPGEWDTYIAALAARGVTSVLPTIITAPMALLHDAAGRVAAAMARHGAILGVHFEGPFLAPDKRGAHRLEWLSAPDAQAILDMGEVVRLVTLAPELPGALKVIARLAAAGVVVSLGHTQADAAQMLAGVEAGARMVTHVFNAQTGLGHRAPGAPAVALTDERVWPCLIVDGVHVDPLVLKLAFAACPRAVAVTDCVALAGLDAGAEVIFGGAIARLDARGVAVRADGTIAGAGITLDEGVRRLIQAGVAPAVALAAATSRPAAAMGIADRGRIASGCRADLVWFGDDFAVRRVWTAGVTRFGQRVARGTEAAREDLADLDERGTLKIVHLFLAQEVLAQRALAVVAGDLAALADAVAARLQAGGRLFYVGAGTSGRMGLLDAVECGPTFGVDDGRIVPVLAGGTGAFATAVEGAEDDGEAAVGALRAHALGAEDALIGIAASGATPFTAAAVRYANEVGALSGAIVNNVEAVMAREARIAVRIGSGAEVIAGSTRLSAGTAQKVALNVLSSTVMIRLGKVFGPYMVDMRATNAKLRGRAERMVAKLASVEDTAARLALEDCGYHVKTAVLMLRRGVHADVAAALLKASDFSLRRALQASN